MDLNKFMQAFGLLFVAIGTVFAVSGVVAGMGSLVFMGVCFLVLFCGIGGFFAWTGISNMNRERKINEKGYAVMGKIFDYVPDNQMTLNGQPTLSLIVQGGRFHQAGRCPDRPGRYGCFPQRSDCDDQPLRRGGRAGARKCLRCPASG